MDIENNSTTFLNRTIAVNHHTLNLIVIPEIKVVLQKHQQTVILNVCCKLLKSESAKILNFDKSTIIDE